MLKILNVLSIYSWFIYDLYIHIDVGVLVHPAFICINRTKAVLPDHLHKKDKWKKEQEVNKNLKRLHFHS